MKRRRKEAGVPNEELMRAMLGKRGSSAAGPHKDKRDKRARTRAAKKNRAMGDQE